MLKARREKLCKGLKILAAEATRELIGLLEPPVRV